MTLRLTFHDGQTGRKAAKLPESTNLEDVIYRAAEGMLLRAPLGKRVRVLGLSVGELQRGAAHPQMSLFDGGRASRRQIAEAKDEFRGR